MEVDTYDAGNSDPVVVNLFYPRVEGNPEEITIALMDVRAANDISIKYDFERDGWSILSDLLDPDIHDVQSDELHEVAFVPAWPTKETN